MTTVNWKLKAWKQLMKLPSSDRNKIYDTVETLAEWPKAHNVIALVEQDGYRLRVGRYRILFTVDPQGQKTVITIEKVSKRDERTYKQ